MDSTHGGSRLWPAGTIGPIHVRCAWSVRHRGGRPLRPIVGALQRVLVADWHVCLVVLALRLRRVGV